MNPILFAIAVLLGVLVAIAMLFLILVAMLYAAIEMAAEAWKANHRGKR